MKRALCFDIGSTWTVEAAGDYLRRELAERHLSSEHFARHVAAVTARPDYLPRDAVGKVCDEVLAGVCFYHGLLRHAGTVEESYTSHGKVFVQRGKDLRRVRQLIGSGGYLARCLSTDLQHRVLAALRQDTGGARLVPETVRYHADADYLWPLLGNLAADYPAEAARLAVEHLVPAEGAPATAPTEDCIWR